MRHGNLLLRRRRPRLLRLIHNGVTVCAVFVAKSFVPVVSNGKVYMAVKVCTILILTLHIDPDGSTGVRLCPCTETTGGIDFIGRYREIFTTTA
ncbi:unknown [Prevotella sp. CAG:1031]|nr:unknown [Prevotella sp. CAG:1031]